MNEGSDDTLLTGEDAPGLNEVTAQPCGGTYILRLYVTGTTPNSRRAIQNVEAICDQHLKGRYRLEIIDIYQQPALARNAEIIAAPTLVKESPPPLRRFVGNLSQTSKILRGLGIEAQG